MVGGHAVAGHGEPRLTEDLDVLIAATPANGRRLRAALVKFGFGPMLPPADALIKPGKIWMLGRKPWRIDLLTSIDGVEFAAVWKGRVEAAFDPAPIPVIGLRELLVNKRASGRAKDAVDADRLELLNAPGGKRKRKRPR